jgi:hypothetical protein
MTATRILIAAALVMSGGAATAQSATDAQCFILSNAFAAQAKEADAQKAAEASIYFYLGRIRDGATGTQLKTLFDAQAKTINDKNASTLLNACIKNVQDKQQLVQSIAPKRAEQPASTTTPTTPPPPGSR